MSKFYTRGNLNCVEAIRVHTKSAHAVLASPAKGAASTDRTVDVSILEATHQNEALLKEMPKDQNVGPTGEMHPC